MQHSPIFYRADMDSPIDFRGRAALITGASGQIGRTIATTLAHFGASVALHWHHGEAAARTTARTIEKSGGKAFCAQGDIRSAESVEQMRRTIQSAIGNVDLLVINAVSQYHWKPLLEQDASDYLDQFQTTVLQTVHLIKAFAPAMVENGFGRIVGISTECIVQCLPTQSAYVAGKRGMDGTLRVLARELGPSGITVNQVAPGWTLTERDREAGTDSHTAYENGIPLRHRVSDQDIANAVAFLCSDMAASITGAWLPVTGGNVMPGV